jgi:hypothetical protein
MVGTTRSGRPLPERKKSSYGRAADLSGATSGRFQNKLTKNRSTTRDVTKGVLV